MKNKNLGLKLKALRKKKGYSQEDLAEEAKISLKTIQRIENAQTDPTGDTIRRIANALKVTPDQLLDWEILEDNNYLKAINLSGFSFLLFPMMGILIPSIMWLAKKDKIKNLNDTAKSLINFQITWNIILILGLLVYLLLLKLKISNTNEVSIDMFKPYYNTLIVYITTLYLINLGYLTINTLRVKKDQNVNYNPKLSLIK